MTIGKQINMIGWYAFRCQLMKECHGMPEDVLMDIVAFHLVQYLKYLGTRG